MNANRMSKWIVRSVAGLGVLAAMTASLSPASAQFQRYDRDRDWEQDRNRRERTDRNGRNGNNRDWNNRDRDNGNNRNRNDQYRNDRDWNNRDRDNRNRNDRTFTWSEIGGRPGLDSNDRPGFYVWRDRDDLYIVANGRDGGRVGRFSGDIAVQGGSISRVVGVGTGRGDRYRQTGDNRLSFRFSTDDGLDGVRFRVNRGDRIVLNLRAADGAYADRVYLGRNREQTFRNPLVIVK